MMIHGDDVISPTQVGPRHPARDGITLNTVRGQYPSGTAMSPISNVVSVGSNRIDRELIGQVCPDNQVFEHGFGHWRATNISGTDK
jgi:hypothetical protein